MLSKIHAGAPPLEPEYEVRIFDRHGGLFDVLEVTHVGKNVYRTSCITKFGNALTLLLYCDGKHVADIGFCHYLGAADYLDIRLTMPE